MPWLTNPAERQTAIALLRPIFYRAGNFSGRPSGMGGQMSTAKPKLLELQKKQEKKKTRTAQPKRKRGAAKMREAADKIIGRECKPIVEALAKNGKSGQIQSAKFLYDLSVGAEKSSESESARNFRSMALLLANSPQWQGDPDPEKMDDDDMTADD